MPELPARLWWSHNTYYHRWLLKRLPPRLDRVLDVGCGAGRLACTLASRALQVDGIDASPEMIAAAQQRGLPSRRVRWIVGDVLDPAVPLIEGVYDAVTSVSSLHHLPLEEGLDRLSALVRPGGVLAVVGHYRPATIADRWLGHTALAANAAVGAVLALVGRAGKPDDDGMPVQPPTATLAEIRRATGGLEGATVTRGLFWRYLLTWHRPTGS